MRYLTTGIMAATVAALIACGGDGGSPVEPPHGAVVTRLELVTNNALVFTGNRVGMRTLVRAYDSRGQLVQAPALSLTVPQGWTASGDTVVAPTYESAGVVKIAADEAPVQSLDVVAAVDLRGFDWSASWACRQRPGDETKRLGRDMSLWVDSASYLTLEVDSVVYQGDAGWIQNFGGVAQMWMGGAVVYFNSDASADTLALHDMVRVIGYQAPDTLSLWAAQNLGRGGVAVRTNDAPLTYEGLGWCGEDWSGEDDPVTLIGTPRE